MKTKKSCKYFEVCGSTANCSACRGGYQKKTLDKHTRVEYTKVERESKGAK